jgi:beta-lactamase regulating signal transducer with metallopeptidase domain
MTSQDFLLYILKISLLSGLFLGYYWIALRNKRFHYYNRFYLLASIALSLIIPILKFDWISNEKPVFMGSGASIDSMIGSTTQVSNSINIGQVSLLFIQLVSFLLISTICYNIFKIYRIKKQSQITKLEGFDLMYTDEDSAPFSFLNNLFWKRSISIDDEGGKQIFKHELTHIQQKHTWDRLFAQLSCSIFWINPFYWLIQKELETIHEFIADEAAVDSHDIESFAKMLLQAHYGNHFFETKHSFFYSSIKRRLTMLTTTTNTRFSYLRRVMLLPLLLIGISIFSVRVQAKEKIEKKMKAISATIFHEKIDTTKLSPIAGGVKKVLELNKNALVMIDNKESNMDSAKKINLKDISVFNFWKGENATKKYGNRGAFGAIEILRGNPITKIENIKRDDLIIDTTPVVLVTKTMAPPPVDGPYEKIFTVAQEPASFPGGLHAWTKYLERNLNRNIPVNNGAGPGKYTVELSFIVDKEGGISNVKAEKDPGFGTAEEAIRMIKKGPNWVPAMQNGKKVAYIHNQSITFQISEE